MRQQREVWERHRGTTSARIKLVLTLLLVCSLFITAVIHNESLGPALPQDTSALGQGFTPFSDVSGMLTGATIGLALEEEELVEEPDSNNEETADNPTEEKITEPDIEEEEAIKPVLEFAFENEFSTTGVVRPTDPEGMVAYAELNVQTPRYRIWNGSNFGSELTDTIDAGWTINWVILKASHERDEFIMGTIGEGTNKFANLQIYSNGTGWHSQSNTSTALANTAWHSHDIAYEDVSGDAIVFYEFNSTNIAPDYLNYKIWNGTAMDESDSYFFNLTGYAGHPQVIRAQERISTDEIMVLTLDESSDLSAILWNGTNLTNASTESIVVTDNASTAKEQAFDFGWGKDGDGLVVYGNGKDIAFREYNRTNKSFDHEFTEFFGEKLDAVEVCEDPTSNYMGIIVQGDPFLNADVGVRMWNGTGILPNPPSNDGSTVRHNGFNLVVDCVWLNQSTAMFGFIDGGAKSVDYFTFTKPDTWSTSDLTSTDNTGDFAADDIESLDFIKHPTAEEVMVITTDEDRNLSAIRWDGESFVTVPESSLEPTLDAADPQTPAMFDWFRYDPNPNVTLVNPQDEEYSVGATVHINATVRDNVNVSQVFANITLPDGTEDNIELTDDDGNEIFNGTYSTTTQTGQYNFTIWANDTSTHLNVNDTERGNFTIAAVVSDEINVTELIPPVNTEYNTSNIIEVAANVSGSNKISLVIANISYPNGTTNQVTLSNDTTHVFKFNNSFTTPTVLGDYNLTFFANDTSDNVNQTEVTNFTVVDVRKPEYANVVCNPNPGNISNAIECNATVTDNVALESVTANVTLPNGTIEVQTVENLSSNFNFTFTTTTIPGFFNVTWRANDSSGNIKNSTTNFTINDVVNPSVFNLTPTENSIFNFSDIIEIGANITDDVAVHATTADVSFPNGTIETLTLTNGTDHEFIFNVSFTIPTLAGTYNVTFFANDTSNNINNTESTNFTIVETPAEETTSPSPSGGGGGGGGGGSYPVYQCVEQSDCPEGTYCVDNKCLKIFDLVILHADSPVEPEEYLDFSYFIKAMSDIEGDVTLDFWIEGQNKIIATGSDIIFVGSYEEKIEEAKLYIPSDAPEGPYIIYVKLTFAPYTITAHRNIEVKKDAPLFFTIDLIDFPTVNPDEAWSFKSIVASNKDETLPVTYTRSITQRGTNYWAKESGIVLDPSEIVSDSVPGLAEGRYDLVLTATSGEDSSELTQSFTVGDGRDLRWLLDLLRLILAILAVAGVIPLLIMYYRKKKKEEKVDPNVRRLEKWLRTVLKMGLSREKIETLVTESGWTHAQLNQALDRIRAKKIKGKLPSLKR